MFFTPQSRFGLHSKNRSKRREKKCMYVHTDTCEIYHKEPMFTWLWKLGSPTVRHLQPREVGGVVLGTGGFSELEGSRSKRRSLSQLSRQAGRQGAFLLIQSLHGFHEHPPRHTHTHTSSRAFSFTPSTVHRLQCSSHLETASQTLSEMTFNQDTLCPS